MKLCVLVCAIVAATESVKLPSNFKTCNRKQANFRGCLLQAARHALTQLNRPYDDLKMPTLDPLYVKRIETSVHTLLFNVTSELTECQLYNLLHLNVEQFDVDFEGKTIQMSAYWPYQKSRCFFKNAGQILFTDVIAEGVVDITYKNLKWTFNLEYEEARKGNKTYVQLSDSSFDAQPEDVIFELVRVRRGDKSLVRSVIRAINNNWRDIFELVKDVYLEKSRTDWLEIFSGFFSEVSLEEAFDN